MGGQADLAAWADTMDVVGQIFGLTKKLEQRHGRSFTPDGHLVGSIGEVVGAALFVLELLPASNPAHDARWVGGLVEIKLTSGTRVALRHEPESLLVLRLGTDMRIETIFNGPGSLAWQAARRPEARKPTTNGQYAVSLKALRALNLEVMEHQRVPHRSGSDELRRLLVQGAAEAE